MYVKTVLTRIISIVRVPSLCFYKDTHNNFDDELKCFSLSVKLEAVFSAKIRLLHWWAFPLLFSSKEEEKSTNWEVVFFFYSKYINLIHIAKLNPFQESMFPLQKYIKKVNEIIETLAFDTLSSSTFSWLVLVYLVLYYIIQHIFYSISMLFSKYILGGCTSHKLYDALPSLASIELRNVSFAQWHYHSLWRSTEAWWLLIENFSQYPARPREIPWAMQCLKDP